MCLLLVLIAVHPAISQTGDRFLYQSAEQRFRAEDYPIALERYEQFLREYPASELVPDVQFRRAVVLFYLGRYQESADLLGRVQARYRSTRYLPFVPFYLGMAQFQLGQYDRAVRSLQSVQVRDPSIQNEARLYIARSQLAMDNTDQAAADLSFLLNDATVSNDIRGFAGALYVSLLYDQQRYAEIPAVMEGIVEQEVSEQWMGQLELFHAEALFFLDELEAAEQLFEQLTAADLEISTVAFQRLFLIAQRSGTSEDVAGVIRRAEQVLAGRSEVLKDFWMRVGLSSFQNEEFRLADLYLRRVWDLRGIHSVDEIVPLYLAEIAEQRGDVDQGIVVLQDFLEQESSPTALFRLAVLQSKAGQWENARSNAAQLRTMYPQSDLFARASYLHAYVLVQSDQYEDALGIIQNLRSRGMTSGIQSDLLRLEAQIHRSMDNPLDAVETFRGYLALRPDDLSATVEFITVLFEQERFAAVQDEIQDVLNSNPDMAEEHPEHFAKLSYLRGLSSVTSGDFVAAANHFAPLSELSAVQARELSSDAAELHPYNLFYHAWSYYQTGRYGQSLRLFRSIANEYPQGSLTPRAVYLAGWSAFADGDMQAAAELLRRVRSFDTDDSLTADAEYLLAQTYIELGDLAEGLVSYRRVFENFPHSNRAKEARFGYAETLVRLDRHDSAVEAFLSVTQRFPDTYIGQESLFRRAQILNDQGAYRQVQEVLFEYRTEYPNGDRIDDALFLGARIAEELNEPSGALLLWNRLIQEHRDSPYRFDAMMNAVRLHRARGEYRHALNLVSEANARYPDQAAAAGGQRIANELVLLVSGVPEREAELRVQIEQNQGASTQIGRDAILELGRTVIYESFEIASDAERAVPLLRDVTQQATQAPDQAAEAYLLLGEYQMRSERYERAAELFLDAAATVETDRDLLARSLFRGAEALINDNRSAQARELIQRIRDSFPQTQWSEAAKRLLED